MKKIFTVLSLLLAFNVLSAQDIKVTQDWQLLGATENISSSSFDGKCVDFVWKYDNGWKLYVANGSSYTLPSGITEFNTINKGEGFWIKGNGNCEINTSNNVNIQALLAGKTFYTVDEDDNNNLQVTKLIFNSALSTIKAISPNSTENWGIDIDGNRLTFSDDADNSYTIIKPMDNYILFEDHNGDDSIDGRGHRLYENKVDAEAYLNSLTSSDLKFTKDMLAGKTFYVVMQKTLEKLKFIFDNDTVSIVGDEDFDKPVSYEIDSNGDLIFSDIKFSFVSKNDNYIEALYASTPSSFTDDTGWFESTYNVNVSSFNNSAIKLKDWFLQNGLWETTITADGKINKFADKKYNGYWYIKNNIFYFAYPDNDGGDHLDIKAYKVENDKLLKQTDAPYSETIRLYFDKTKRDAWLNSLIKNN